MVRWLRVFADLLKDSISVPNTCLRGSDTLMPSLGTPTQVTYIHTVTVININVFLKVPIPLSCPLFLLWGPLGLIKAAFVGLIWSYPGAWFIHQWLATKDFYPSHPNHLLPE